MRTSQQHKICSLPETPEFSETFKQWWDPALKNVFFAMNVRYWTSYCKGDQLFNSYGLRSNRFLIANYGFTMRQNRYNSLNFKVFVNDVTDPLQTNRHVKILKLKKDRLNLCLL